MSDLKTITEILEKLPNAHVLCVGDVILDQFVYGEAERISPEAPIPVLRVKSRVYTLGGVGNVVANIAALGGEATIIGVVGQDGGAIKVAEMLGEYAGVRSGIVASDERPTSFKTRYVASGQQVLRVDEEESAAIGAEAEVQILDAIAEAIGQANIVVLSDYGKGVLSNKVIRAVIQAAGRRDIPVLVDPKGVDYARYQGADVITPNRAELSRATGGMAVESDAEIVAAAQSLITNTGVPTVIATRSADGVSIVQDLAEPIHMPTHARDVFDVSGAGDTFVAGLAAALGSGANVRQAAELANIAAGLAVEKLGTAVVRSDDVMRYLERKGLFSHVMNLQQAKEQVLKWKARGFEVGLTNGCFDILHQGHVVMLDACRKLCDRLIVGVNVDASVSRLKGDTRPVNGQDARAIVLAGLASVDGVVFFGENADENDTPIKLMEALRPDVIFKGQDYTIDKVVGADLVQGYGGRVELVALQDGFSTSAVIKKISA